MRTYGLTVLFICSIVFCGDAVLVRFKKKGKTIKNITMADDGKTICKYGASCYQKNPAHKAKFSHPSKPPVGATGTRTRRRNRSPSDYDDGSSTSSDSDVPPSRRVKVSQSPPSSPPSSIGLVDNNMPSYVTDLKTTPPSTKKRLASLANRSPNDSSGKEDREEEGPSPEQDLDFINNCFDQETPYSQRVEYKEMLKDASVFIKQKFLVDMPSDFYAFWEFCKLHSENSPEKVLEAFGIRLVGPFDVLAGRFDEARMFEPGSYLRHCRYYYDPPEFQTVLHLHKTGVHYGYWRDVPSETKKCMLAKNDMKKGCEITMVAVNIFAAIIYFLDKDIPATPFNRSKVKAMKKLITAYAKDNMIELNSFSEANRARNLTVVCKTFHKAGLVVPIDNKTQVGYRELLETDAALKKMLEPLNKDEITDREMATAMEKLQPLITAASIAVDECDFGNSIELGLDLFCNGSKRLHAVLLQLLVNGYSMVARPQFIAILKAHLEQRDRHLDMSIL